MRKGIFVLSVVMAYPALAQVVSGSIVIFNFTKNESIVAADSLANNHDTGIPDYSHCKIATLGHQFIFTSVGNAAWSDHGHLLWENNELARDAFHAVSSTGSGTVNLHDTVGHWARDVSARWTTLDRERVIDVAAANGRQITAGVFLGKDLAVEAAVIYPNIANMFEPIRYVIANGQIDDCWPCGQLTGEICGAGVHLDVAANFCSNRKHGDKIRIRTPLRRGSESTKLAVKIVELTIDAYEKSAKDVGGAVDAVTISKAGGITWNSRKQNCPDNQE